ncbi:MAG: hypothetical protein AB1768_09145 [Pseudomonadota bacterium]|jgi:hypothetical protein
MGLRLAPFFLPQFSTSVRSLLALVRHRLALQRARHRRILREPAVVDEVIAFLKKG